METNVNYTAVGIFVISLVAAFVLGTLWLSAGFSIQTYSTYIVYMEESVSGLSADAAVEYNGVEVGSIKSIVIDKKNPRAVEILLSIKDGTPITQGTQATLNTRGLTGLTFLALKDDGSDLTPLHAERGQPYPIIKTAPSLFLRIDTAVQRLTNSLTKLSNAMQSLLDEENQRSIKEILINMDKVTHTLANNSAKLNAILTNTANATARLPTLFQTFETETLPATNQMMTNLNDVSHTISSAAEEIKQNPAVLIRGKTPQPLGPGE